MSLWQGNRITESFGGWSVDARSEGGDDVAELGFTVEVIGI